MSPAPTPIAKAADKAADAGDEVHDEPSSLDRLDIALGRLRRLWDQPDVREWFSARIPVGEIEASMFRTLRAVRALGPEGASVNDVAELLRIDASTASRFLERAVAAGLAERTTSAVDRRRSSITLSTEGRDHLRRLRRVRLELLGEVTVDWAPEDVDLLADLLTRLDEAVSALGVRHEG